MTLTTSEYEILKSSIATQWLHDKQNAHWVYFMTKMRTPTTSYNKDDLEFLLIYVKRLLTSVESASKLIEGNNDTNSIRLNFLGENLVSIRNKIDAKRQAIDSKSNISLEGQQGSGQVGPNLDAGTSK